MARLKCCNCGKCVSEYEFPAWLAKEPWFAHAECGKCGRATAHERTAAGRAREAVEGILGMLVDPERWALVLSGRTIEEAADVTMAVAQDLIYAAKTLAGRGNGEFQPRFAEYVQAGRDVALWGRVLFPVPDAAAQGLAKKGGGS